MSSKGWFWLLVFAACSSLGVPLLPLLFIIVPALFHMFGVVSEFDRRLYELAKKRQEELDAQTSNP